jgi:adhesin transport system membrane fusion protein
MSEANFKKLAKELAGKQKSSSSILLLVVITLVLVTFVWASIAEIDNVVRGSGKTISEAKNQLVQSSESGVIRKRYVSTGDFVKKGERLFDIDPIDARTLLDQVEKRYSTLSVKSIRLKAEVSNVVPKYSQELIEASPTTVSTELALYRARLDDLSTKSAILDQQRIQKQNEIQELKIQFKTTSNSLALIRREIATLEPLVKSGLAPETRLIALRRDEEASIGIANQAESGQKRLVSGLDEIDERLKAELQSYKTSALTDLSSIESELSELKARIPALENRVERNTVKSPVDGVINRINFVTADAYISTGEILLEIVPTGSDLIVETRINPKDIAEIMIGQDVKISLTAYDPSRYGRIDGRVLGISADAISDEQTREQNYLVDVSMIGTLYEDNGEEVAILPGMVASIDVLSGKRTILDYFWQPISKTKNRAFRE